MACDLKRGVGVTAYIIGSLAADLMTPNENRLRCLSSVALGGPEPPFLCEGLRLRRRFFGLASCGDSNRLIEIGRS